jgi:acetate kinase
MDYCLSEKWKHLPNTQSGLLGVSALTNDMRELQSELRFIGSRQTFLGRNQVL